MTKAFTVALALSGALPAGASAAAADKPNIPVIWGDDIGIWNISRYNMGQMGYQTPNIDRIANEGWSSQTTTASRAARRAAPLSSRASARCARD